MKTLTHPSLHLNGSSAESLLEGYGKASYALVEALRLLRDTAPNSRDYYVQGPTAFGNAVKEHEARMARLHDVRSEIDSLMETVEQSALERQRNR